jgi:hypothetical protein
MAGIDLLEHSSLDPVSRAKKRFQGRGILRKGERGMEKDLDFVKEMPKPIIP